MCVSKLETTAAKFRYAHRGLERADESVKKKAPTKALDSGSLELYPYFAVDLGNINSNLQTLKSNHLISYSTRRKHLPECDRGEHFIVQLKKYSTSLKMNIHILL